MAFAGPSPDLFGKEISLWIGKRQDPKTPRILNVFSAFRPDQIHLHKTAKYITKGSNERNILVSSYMYLHRSGNRQKSVFPIADFPVEKPHQNLGLRAAGESAVCQRAGTESFSADVLN